MDRARNYWRAVSTEIFQDFPRVRVESTAHSCENEYTEEYSLIMYYKLHEQFKFLNGHAVLDFCQ